MRICHPFTVLLACSVFFGCSGGGGGGIAWEGEEPHLIVRGIIDGEMVDIELRGAEALAAGISCEREYLADESPSMPGEPDLATAVFNEVKINATVTINGEQRFLELELKQHDLQGDAIGADITVVPRLAVGLPAADEMWLEFEWQTLPDETTVLEVAALEGNVTLERFTGTPGADTVVIPSGDGEIGVTIDARWSPTDSLLISVTAPCVDSDVGLN